MSTGARVNRHDSEETAVGQSRVSGRRDTSASDTGAHNRPRHFARSLLHGRQSKGSSRVPQSTALHSSAHACQKARVEALHARHVCTGGHWGKERHTGEQVRLIQKKKTGVCAQAVSLPRVDATRGTAVARKHALDYGEGASPGDGGMRQTQATSPAVPDPQRQWPGRLASLPRGSRGYNACRSMSWH